MKLRRSIAVAIAFACLIPATANASIGKTTVGDWADQPGDGSAGSAQDWRATASTSETVNRLSVYLLRGTTGKPELGLYDASKTKLASCTISTVVARAWNRCSIPDIGVSAVSTYWLALVRPRRQGVVVFSNRSGSGASYGSLLSNLTAALPTWLDGVFYGRQKASLYAASATPPPPPDTT